MNGGYALASEAICAIANSGGAAEDGCRCVRQRTELCRAHAYSAQMPSRAAGLFAGFPMSRSMLMLALLTALSLNVAHPW